MPISPLLQQVAEVAVQARLASADSGCRRHFQKNSLISGTFEPPEMYSTLLS